MTAPVIVLYHHIAATHTDFEVGIGVTSRPESFDAHLEYFQRNYDLISLSDLLDGPLPRRPLLLTFDDAYRSVLDVVRTCLAPTGIPAVLFTNPELLAPALPGFDNVLSWYEARHGLPALCELIGSRRQTSLGVLLRGPLACMGASAREALRQRLMQEGGMDAAAITVRSPVLAPEDLRTLTRLGVEIGNHTATHVHCRALDAAEQYTELVASRQRLEEICGQPVRAFSVPYGNADDLTPVVQSALRDSGHRAIFLVHARSNRFRPSPDVWYRVSLHDEPVSRLDRELGLKPLLRSLRALIGRRL